MDKKEKLLSMLQPESYVSKIKKYCDICTPIGINVKNKLKEFEYNTKND